MSVLISKRLAIFSQAQMIKVEDGRKNKIGFRFATEAQIRFA